MTPPITALGSRYGIQGALGRSVKRAAAGYTTWWDLDGTITSCIVAYQPKGAANYDASTTNLANPSNYTATAVGTPVWDETNGWDGNGGWYLKIGTVGLGFSSVPTIICRFSAPNNYGSIFGNTYTISVTARALPKIRYNMAGDTYTDIDVGDSSFGVIAMNDKAYFNGVYLGNLSTLTSYSASTFSALAQGNGDFKSSVNIQAMAVYTDILSGEVISDLTDAMAAL
jgi:hypothetical protein